MSEAAVADHVTLPMRATPNIIVFDRDGTLIHNVGFDDDDPMFIPVDEARDALMLARRAGAGIGVMSSRRSSRGLIDIDLVQALDERVDEELGPFSVWGNSFEHIVEQLQRPVSKYVLISDAGSELEVARKAGARAILVPSAATLPSEIALADEACSTLVHAVRRALQPRTKEFRLDC